MSYHATYDHMLEEPSDPNRTFGAPRRVYEDVGCCDTCGSDKFVRILADGEKRCVRCCDEEDEKAEHKAELDLTRDAMSLYENMAMEDGL